MVAGIVAQQRMGAPVNAAALDRALLITDDLPGVRVAGALRPGKNEGETDLVLHLAPEPLIAGDASADNTGARSTGSARATVNLAVASPLGFGDLFGLTALHAYGTDYLRLSASAPVGLNGWRVGVSASQLQYQLVAAEFAALEAKGSSGSVGAEAVYPLVRSRDKNLYLALNYDHKRFDNRSAGAITSHYAASVLSAGLNANSFDGLASSGVGGASSGSLVLSSGKIDLASSPNRAADAASARTAGTYSKLRYSLVREQNLGSAWSLVAALSGQEASKNLDSSEKFYLGGASGVRAYPANEGGGATAQMLNVDLRHRLSSSLAIAGFVDWGRVVANKDNSFAGAPAANSTTLKGLGVSLAWQSASGFNVKTILARRIGNNPNPSATGADQDGSLVKNRLWLVASLPL